jgi:hypothetical protein
MRGRGSASVALPRIHRARGFRLYDMQGRRYLDLYRDGALLGHRAASTVTVMKSVLSQGLATGLPSAWDGKVAAAIRLLFPGYPCVRLYSSPGRALEAARSFLGESAVSAWDPATAEKPEESPAVALGRLFLPLPAGARVLLPVLPFSLCGAPAPVCFPEEPSGEVPGSDLLPGFLLAGALRACAAFFPGCEAGLPVLGNGALDRALDAGRAWVRRGPYVRPAFASDDYPRVHAEFLHAGVLLCPGFPGPSVLPGDCSPGETRLLIDLFTGVPGG